MSWKEYRLDDDFIPKRKKSKGKKGSDKKGSDKKGSDKKSSDKKGSDKKGSDKKGSGKKGSDKRNPEKQDSNKRNSEKKGSVKKTLNKKASEKKISGRRNGKKSDKKMDQKYDQKLKNREALPISDEKKSKILNLLMDPNYRPMKTKEIAVLLGIPKAQRLMLQEILDDLVASGSANISKKGKYRFSDQLKAKEARISDSDDRTSDSDDVKLSVFPEGTDPKSLVGQTVTGTFTVHPKGFGFLTIEGFPEDLYVSRENRFGAMHKDIVEAMILPLPAEGRRQEARILSVRSHGIERLVGTFEQSKHFGFVIPDDKHFDEDIFIPEGRTLHAVTGHKVVCTLTSFGSRGKKPEGIVTEILGHRSDPGTDVLSIVRAMGIDEEFPEEVLRNADRVSDPVSVEDTVGRMDLRNTLMVTIDGDDSKDLDDAVSLQKDGDHYLLGVHIADVSQYVREGSELDKEALKRGTSIYLADRVIPMLPHTLSNGICSLNHDEDRLALSCLMTIDAEGRVIDHLITESVVNINYRMTYHNVKLITIDQDPKARSQYQEITPMLDEMLKLSRILRKRRHKDGSIDFNFPEYEAVLDEKGRPLDFVPEEHSEANELIEEFMVLANETVAEEYCRAELPFLYRIHGEPDRDQIKDLSLFVENFGLTLHRSNDGIRPKDIQQLIEKSEEKPEGELIRMLTLRAMQQAKYSPECSGHFGLAAKYYCHFTSPIRRYPDLQIHRIIKENLHHKLDEKRIRHYRKILTSVAEESSSLERRADEAEREVMKLKKAEYMQDHLGDVYDGIISGITAWGIYVQLPNSIEGLVHVSTMMDDFYHFDEKNYCLVGERYRRVFRMSQPVQIQVAAADTESRLIDFTLVD
ncbi:MAG: ribonuclease R [Lachnospiraceae bacterium]|nr:ribonuclease R [Lachnospiraceae bacterium]